MATTYEICIANDDPELEEWFDAAALGVSDAPERVTCVSGIDTVTLRVVAADALTADTIFAYDALIRLRRVTDGTPTLLFLGRCDDPDRSADPAEAYTVTLLGIWDWFERTIMRQAWLENEVYVSKPRVVLFCDDAGARMTTGAQIKQCIDAARSGGCPCAEPLSGDIDTGFTPPFDEQINISVAVAINKALSNHPHACIWTDYSVRAPRVYCRQRQALPSVTLSCAGQAGVRVKARHDLQPSAVAIAFETDFTEDEICYKRSVIQFAPFISGETAGQTEQRLSQAGVVWGVYDLQGGQAQSESQEIEAEDVPEGLEDLDWWKEKIPWLNDYDAGDIEIIDAYREGEEDYPRLLTKGAITTWMKVAYGVGSENETFTAVFNVIVRSDGQIVEVRKQIEHVQLISTNASGKTYKIWKSYDSGESIPAAVAATMWAEWQQLHHEGSICVVEEECSLAAAIGKTLNISNGIAGWAYMAAMIIRVTERFDAGATTVEFGVPGWVDLDSRVSFERACRSRRFSWSREFKTSDTGGDGVGGIENTAASRDGRNVLDIVRRRLFDPDAEVKHEIDLWAKAVSGGFEFATEGDAATARVIRPREVLIPYNDAGTIKAKLVQALCSGSYGDPVNIIGLPSTPTSWVTFNASGNSLTAASAPDWQPNTDGKGLKVYHHRAAYKSSSTEELQGYWWLERFAADGRLLSVSGETKYTINTPEA